MMLMMIMMKNKTTKNLQKKKFNKKRKHKRRYEKHDVTSFGATAGFPCLIFMLVISPSST